MSRPSHIKWFVEEQGIRLKDNTPVNCYFIDYQDDDFILSGAATYFFADDYGSAKVLSKKANDYLKRLDNRNPQKLLLFYELLSELVIVHEQVKETYRISIS